MPATYVSTDGDLVAAEPTSAELTHLTHTIARRVGRSLERLGLLERDAENSYLTGDVVERGHWSRPHERPLSVFGLACDYPPRMAGHGTLEPVDVAPHEAEIETLWAFDIRTTLVPMSGIAGIYLWVGDGGNRPDPAIPRSMNWTA